MLPEHAGGVSRIKKLQIQGALGFPRMVQVEREWKDNQENQFEEMIQLD